jgi:dihydrofolate reductase
VVAAHADLNEIVWITGGSKVYEDAMNSELCHRIYLTEIDKVTTLRS